MNLTIAVQRINVECCDVTEKQIVKPVPKRHTMAKLEATQSNIKQSAWYFVFLLLEHEL